MKTTILKTAFAAVLIFSAMALVTCQPALPEGEDGAVEYTDVIYDVIGSPGNERVRSVTLYLDGYTVPKPRSQKVFEQQQRALGLQAAKMSHDFFEVIFVNSDTWRARASWRIGQAAGISGVKGAAGASGITYSNVIGTLPSAVIFVGKYSSRTLLGVGWLTHVNDTPSTYTVNNTSRSVMFTVSPLITNIGFNETGGASPDPITYTARDTFVTAAGATPGGSPTLAFAGANTGNTRGDNRELVRGAKYPFFALPSWEGRATTVTYMTVEATYKIGGLDPGVALPGTAGGPTVDLKPAVFVYGRDPALTPVTGAPVGGLQFITRTPAFMYQGAWYEPSGIVDKATSVALDPVTLNNSHQGNFDPVMKLIFTMTTASMGYFAITFQVPVYMMTMESSSQGGPGYEKWYIRPDYSEYQYLLDNGIDAGGAVLLGNVSAASGDWLEIQTEGMGFSN